MSDTYLVISNQQAPHPSTESRAEKHASANYCRPFSKTQITAFKSCDDFVKEKSRKVIIDSGCGTGDSTLSLARNFPDHSVIGIDRSEQRLAKAKKKLQESPAKNLFFARARLEDFWRLARNSDWEIESHYIFYPNPWPKAEHQSQRWHGHSVFPDLLTLSPNLELRTNWLLYLQEFSIAVQTLTNVLQMPKLIRNPEGISAFERKYKASASPCYLLRYEGLPKQIKRKAGL